MTNSPSEKVARRQTAAQRVRAALEEQMRAMTAGVDAARKAHSRHEEALAAADVADDRFREAVDALVLTGQSLEDIADLCEVPLPKVRAARRPKRGAAEILADSEAGQDEPAPDDVVAELSPSGGRRRARRIDVEPPADPPKVPPFLAAAGGEQPGDGEGEGGPELAAVGQ